ncbi:MAG: TetR/AcrR family transcriptional regulator [Candidatus Avoscillospira sp.]
MNEKFFALPEEKQNRIINAGYRVFSQNSYKKSPVGEVAAEAGISKSLLFHYFRNKQALYLFLWNKGAEVTMEYLNRYGCYEPGSLFEQMERGMKAKMEVMRRYPHMTAFVLKAFYEKDPAVRPAIQKSYRYYFGLKASKALLQADPEVFVPGLDLEMMYREMYWASEGYLWEMVQRDDLDVDRLERDFVRLMDFWKRVYLRKKEGE